MESNQAGKFTIDKDNNKIIVERSFSAPIERVWDAWTKSELLDQWWAPKPWRAVTKVMEFREGGQWLYSMEGPKGEKTWGKAVFKNIDHLNSFEVVDVFSDENGIGNNELPTLYWDIVFHSVDTNTVVTIEVKFDIPSDLEKIIEMGFKEGFEGGLDNLEEFLKT